MSLSSDFIIVCTTLTIKVIPPEVFSRQTLCLIGPWLARNNLCTVNWTVLFSAGDNGTSGVPGENGEPGEPGLKGNRGNDTTTPGLKGAKGAEGFPGTPGIQGPPGDPGPQGTENVLPPVTTEMSNWREVICALRLIAATFFVVEAKLCQYHFISSIDVTSVCCFRSTRPCSWP